MYLALYRKYRPLIFDDVISQPHITIPLKNQVKLNRCAHAYLFTGSRGTGKTTCSKILAKAVNCLHPVDGNPCLECEVCKGIEDGSILDVVEIDAASNNGVDSIRELREEANFTPAVCRYRVYIIDEAHMLSTGAFNALLKIMEEPPSHVIFILATTEVHKVPATILSRCQRYDFRRILSEDIAARLQYVAKLEQLSLTDDGAQLIAKLSDGGMRDALSLLDQCASASQTIDGEAVGAAAGLAGRDYLFKLSRAVLQKDAAAAMALIDELHGKMSDLSRLCDELIAHYRNLMIVKTVREPGALIVCPPAELTDLQETAKGYALNGILHALTVLQDCAARLGRVSSKRLELEMALLRLCSKEESTGAPSASDPGLAARIERLEQAVASLLNAPPQRAERAALSSDAPPPPMEVPPAVSSQPQAPLAGSKPLKTEVDWSKLAPLSCWTEILKKLGTDDPPLSGILFGSQAYELEDILFIDSPNKMFAKLLKQEGCAQRLGETIFKQTGKKYRIRLRSGGKGSAGAPGAAQKQESQPDPLDALAAAARESGAQVNIKE